VLDHDVIDGGGKRLGRIHDVRLVQDVAGPQDAPALFRLDAVVIGRRGLAIRLGYARGHVGGPWLVKWLLTTFSSSPEEIAWRDLRPTDDGRFVR